ncbi:hypothetical protein EcWSU1_02613 [Enterobacter ludwigii]|uniref:Uncharacterized protein n=1 Tax=Enterobacter ludwigii TaxID=299767 RepID=G8LF63_9ENTR|nr:hypothetical protein EcWSU1_02613 [Enterobacter ludwigii]
MIIRLRGLRAAFFYHYSSYNILMAFEEQCLWVTL